MKNLLFVLLASLALLACEPKDALAPNEQAVAKSTADPDPMVVQMDGEDFEFVVGQPYQYVSKVGSKSIKMTLVVAADGTTMTISREEIPAQQEHKAASWSLAASTVEASTELLENTVAFKNGAQLIPFDQTVQPVILGGVTSTRYRCTCEGGRGDCRVNLRWDGNKFVHECINEGCTNDSGTATCKAETLNGTQTMGATVAIPSKYNLILN